MNLYKTDELLHAAELAIEGALTNPSACQQLEVYGMSSAQLQTGKLRWRTLAQLHEVHTSLRNERYAISQQINASLQAVNEQFRAHVNIAQSAFHQNPALFEALGVSPLATRRWECVRQAARFYQQLYIRDVSLEAYGVSAVALLHAQEQVQQLLTLKEERVQKKALVDERAKEVRGAKLALRAWMVEFRMVARIALRSHPQMLELFGVQSVTAG